MINLSAYLRICLSIEDFMYLSSNIVKVGAHFECTDPNAYSPGRGEDTRMVHIVGISRQTDTQTDRERKREPKSKQCILLMTMVIPER